MQDKKILLMASFFPPSFKKSFFYLMIKVVWQMLLLPLLTLIGKNKEGVRRVKKENKTTHNSPNLRATVIF